MASLSRRDPPSRAGRSRRWVRVNIPKGDAPAEANSPGRRGGPLRIRFSRRGFLRAKPRHETSVGSGQSVGMLLLACAYGAEGPEVNAPQSGLQVGPRRDAGLPLRDERVRRSSRPCHGARRSFPRRGPDLRLAAHSLSIRSCQRPLGVQIEIRAMSRETVLFI